MPELDKEGKVTNLNTDWKNGVNLACLLDALQPGCFPNWQGLNPANAPENFALAMKCGKEHFGLKPVKITDGGVDEPSLATYLTHLQRSVTRPDAFMPNGVEVACEGPGLSKATMGRSATFEIDATRVQGETRDYEPSITITDSKNTAIEPQIKSNGKGKFRVEYKPWLIGKLKVDIKWKSNPVPGSPFSVDVIDGILLQDSNGATDLDAKVDLHAQK